MAKKEEASGGDEKSQSTELVCPMGEPPPTDALDSRVFTCAPDGEGCRDYLVLGLGHGSRSIPWLHSTCRVVYVAIKHYRVVVVALLTPVPWVVFHIPLHTFKLSFFSVCVVSCFCQNRMLFCAFVFFLPTYFAAQVGLGGLSSWTRTYRA